MSNKDKMFTILNEDFNKVYKLVDAVLSTCPEKSMEFIAASALKERLDQAIDLGEEELVFSEVEVQCLSYVVS